MEAELSVKIVTIILILIATVQQMHTKNVEKIVNTYLYKSAMFSASVRFFFFTAN